MLAGRVARAFYLDERAQVDIAADLQLSRYQVARLLAVAKANGMVHIRITAPSGIDHDLSKRLAAVLGIERAVVVTPIDPATVVEELGRILARELEDDVAEGDVVGLTWSRATISMVQQLQSLARCSLVQLGGHVEGVSGMPGTFELLLRAAQVSAGRAFPIFAPLFVGDAHTAQTLRQQSSIRTALALHDRLDVAVVSVGNWAAGGSTIFDTLPAGIRTRARDRGVVGEIGGRMYDQSGAPVPEFLDERIIGASLEQLRTARRRIATSYGEHRADATIAAARGGLVGTLVADVTLADAVIARCAEIDAPGE
ncbi:DeoR family transcriptional regulator [Curtobacterium sp. MCSS17_008]|uniref:sugar-binding transcriptional regulator n=1 Tax=Curtobacterium sp. MCSS17_008 TaxID=2175647 RepID=UPI000DA83112|nr:sugar-binding domain-containing protein [Curtobacterium sp. MCSS17_008]PZF53307.1 DeoR family transcriptional regulator [Curtobacterium sp. MCSS17_008]